MAVEAIRACRRLGDEIADSAEAGLTGIALVPIDEAVLAVAARLDPASCARWTRSTWRPRSSSAAISARCSATTTG
jgi:hypothetical protein